MNAAYVLPLRWSEPGPLAELSRYLRWLAGEVTEVLVIDGSPDDLFAAHSLAFGGDVRHCRPDPDLDSPMGKVNGVITGLRACSCERVVIADDDVRYDGQTLRRTLEMLTGADLVRPQNYFDELPWHARWDSARSLLNRVFTGDPGFPVGDFPGTLALRRSTFLRAGAYDGEALFENLELMRTIRAAGGSVLTPLDLYVARRPPGGAHFRSQRVRQAYDDFAIPLRIGGFLAIGPLTGYLALRRRWWTLGAAVLASIGAAEAGRRRAGATARFPPSGSLLAPAWLAERAVCSWLAVGARLRGGVRYGGGRLRLAAHRQRALRRRYSESGSGGPTGPGEASLSDRNPIVL